MTLGFPQDGPIMSPNLGPAGLRGAQFQALFARSNYPGIGSDLCDTLPHLLPHGSHRRSVRSRHHDRTFMICLGRLAGTGRCLRGFTASPLVESDLDRSRAANIVGPSPQVGADRLVEEHGAARC